MIDVVLEASSSCSDPSRAEKLLSSALATVRGPRRSEGAENHWQLTVQIASVAPGIKAADAAILDEQGTIVAERSISERTAESCVGLARAVGAWAQIVIDDALVREHDAVDRRAGDPSFPPAEVPSTDTIPIELRPARAAAPGPEFEDSERPPAAKSDGFEVGSMLFLRNGAAATGGIFGVTSFLTVSIASQWIVRPAVMYGTSTSRAPPDPSNSANVSLLGGRIDVCRRIPGNYIDHRGIEVDVCIGGDAASVWSVHQSVARGSIGPSAVVRGELSHGIGIEIRPLLGVNVNRARFAGGSELPPFVAGAEVGASVRFR